MVAKHAKGLTAVKLRLVLISSMVALFCVGGALFWFLRSQLVEFATKIQGISVEASTSNANATRLQSIEKTLEDNKSTIAKVANIIGDSEDYRYQEKILDDLARYEEKTGITITSIDFGEASDSSLVPGLKEVDITIAIENPIDYETILQFVRLTESNLPKMQISDLSLVNSSAGTDKVTIQFPSMVIKVFSR